MVPSFPRSVMRKTACISTMEDDYLKAPTVKRTCVQNMLFLEIKLEENRLTARKLSFMYVLVR